MVGAGAFVLWVLVLAVVSLTVCMVLVLQKIGKLVAEVQRFVDRMETEIPGLITSVSHATENISSLAQNVEKKVNDTNELLTSVRELGTSLSNASQSISSLAQNVERKVNDADELFASVRELSTNVSNTSRNISSLAQNVEQKVNDADELFASVRELSRAAAAATRVLKGGTISAAASAKSAVVGFKTALDFISRHRGKGGSKDGA